MTTEAQFDQVFTTDKRITNKAMRVVRTMYPKIGAAYSDAREEGRRYKFQRAGACISKRQVDDINTVFRDNGIKAIAYLHVMDGRGNPYGRSWNWNGHLCVRTYNETNTNNTNTTTTMSKSKNTTANPSQDIANIIASALEKHFAGKSAKQSSDDKEYQFTKDELETYTSIVMEHGAKMILDALKSTDVSSEDNDIVDLDLDGNRIILNFDSTALADQIEDEVEDEYEYEIATNMIDWYNDTTN